MTMWTTRHAGQDEIAPRTRVEPLDDDPTALLIHDGTPDWLRDPITQAQVRVEGRRVLRDLTCPSCKVHVGDVEALLAARDGHPQQQLVVYECPQERKFVFTSQDRQPPAPKEPPRP